MNPVHVVLDSTANISADLLKQHHNLHVVPLKVAVGDREWNENELSAGHLFAQIKETGQFPQTSQPAPGDFMRVFQPIIESGAEVIAIAVSGGISGAAQGARAAARAAGSRKIHVVDSKTTSVGMIRLAERALAMAAQKRGAEEIASDLRARAKRAQTIFLPDSLEYLRRGGRIGGAAALIGSILQIKPILYLDDGEVQVLDKVRTRSKAVGRMLDEACKYAAFDYIDVAHVEAEDEAQALKRRVDELFPTANATVNAAGSVLAAHLGPRVLALFFGQKLDEKAAVI